MGLIASSAATASSGWRVKSSTAPPTSISSEAANCTTPEPTKSRTCSTSLVSRVSSCPVCAWS